MIPIHLTLTSERGVQQTFTMAMVSDQLFTPLLAYLSILNTLRFRTSARTASPATRSRARRQSRNTASSTSRICSPATQPSTGAAASVVGPINLLMRNAFEDVEIEGLKLEIDASEQPRSATLERVWIDGDTAAGRRDGRRCKVLLAPIAATRSPRRCRSRFRPTPRQRVGDGRRRRRGCRSGRRASCRSSRCRRAVCRR